MYLKAKLKAGQLELNPLSLSSETRTRKPKNTRIPSSSTMVKAIPRISERKTRKRRRFPVKSDNLLLGIKMANLTTIPPSSNHLHLLQQTSTPKSDPQILDLIHATPPPLKRKRNSCCPTSSPSYSSSTYATCSSSPAISPSLSSPSPPPPSAFLLRCNSSASSSENSSSAEV